MPKQSLSLDGVQDFSDNKGKPINPGFYCYLILRSEVQTPDKYGIFCNQHGHWEHHFSGKNHRFSRTVIPLFYLKFKVMRTV